MKKRTRARTSWRARERLWSCLIDHHWQSRLLLLDIINKDNLPYLIPWVEMGQRLAKGETLTDLRDRPCYAFPPATTPNPAAAGEAERGEVPFPDWHGGRGETDA